MTRIPLLTAAAFLAACLALTRPASADAPPAPEARVLDALTARPIGPANSGGRISAVAVVEDDPAVMYVGAASGGVWKTADGGDTWAAVFERQGTSSIGDV